MNIKGFLIGSAAALVTVSGAHAADAIVAAEPEPMEYVRVCDAFGKGYFYIPGTETCLKIGGYVRMDARGGELLGLNANEANGSLGDEWDTRSRFDLRLSTASDTEYGALKTYSELRFNWRQGDTSLDVKHAYIDLAGFRVGKTDSAFLTFTDYAGAVLIDDQIDFGVDDANVIQYNYKSDSGITAVISLEDTDSKAAAEAIFGKGTPGSVYQSRHDYIPNIVGGVGYTSEAFSARIVGGYDSAMEEGAIKVRLDGTFGNVSVFAMGGWNTDGDIKNAYANWGGDWAVWGGASVGLTDRVKLNAQLAYDDSETFVANANVAFTVVPGFVVTPEVVYRDRDADGSAWGGIVRFQRSF
ncbi:porin [Shinella sp. M31]|uniref:porin n=1 Tax=Shinella sp. M31 TaxID=3368615 RepID=UPI003B9E9221